MGNPDGGGAVDIRVRVYYPEDRDAGRVRAPGDRRPSCVGFDGWGLHLLFWTFIGFWFPGHELQALFVSLAWETFEDVLGRNHFEVGGKRIQTIGHTDSDCKYTDDAEGNYWYGRFTTDTFFNLAGYILGTALAKKFWPQEPRPRGRHLSARKGAPVRRC